MPPPLVIADVTWDWSRPYVLGIVNVTPDSFSDGGRFHRTDLAIAHAEQLLAEGADALDIGGESTRPGAPPVEVEEEIARVVPVVRALSARGALVSIDTTKAAVARAAFEAGARILNDVGMGDPPEALAAVVRAFDGAYLLMHSRGTPATMVQRAQYSDVVEDVAAELSAGARRLEAAGLDRSRIVLDPGIGFAKRATHSLSLLANIARLRSLGYAVCVGPSRKSFIDAPDAYPSSWQMRAGAPTERQGGTAAAVALAVAAGAEMVRVHDVASMRQAARVADAVRRAGSGRA
jgi:dihydropteroate synthase